MPIMTRYSRKLLYAGLTGAAIAGVLTAGGSYLVHRSTLEEEAVLKSALQHKVTLLEEEIRRKTEEMISAWVPSRDIPAGHFIQAGDLTEVRLPAEAAPANLPTSPEEVAGKGAKIELLKGTPIGLAMLFEEEAASADLRNREMRSVWLPSNLSQNDMVDIRIQFPTGQDYILLSKKRIDKLSSPVFWTTLTEEEILLYSSAMVDAYLHEASIYALTYVEPELQQEAIPNYPPNDEVNRLIKTSPNIVKRAEQQLEHSLRLALEQGLNKISVSDSSYSAGGQGNQDFNTWAAGNQIEDQTIGEYSTGVLSNDQAGEVENNTSKERLEREAEAQAILTSP